MKFRCERDTLADAINGRGPFEKTGPVEAQTLAILYPNKTVDREQLQSLVQRVEQMQPRRDWRERATPSGFSALTAMSG